MPTTIIRVEIDFNKDSTEKEEIIAETRRKKHRKRSVAELHEHFEHFCNAVSAIRYLFQWSL